MKQANFFGLFLTFPLLLASCTIKFVSDSSNSTAESASNETVSSLQSSDSKTSSQEAKSSVDTSSEKESVISVSSEEESVVSASSQEERSSTEITSSSESSIESFVSSEEQRSSEETFSIESSSVEESSVSSGPKTFTFYSVNDFHGAVKEGRDSYNHYESGISKYFGELATRRKADPTHTVLLSAGDMWQGSLESNYTKGLFVTEAMSAAGFEAMAVGNHEFDFGQEIIKNNAKAASFPFLGGNIMNYVNGQTTSTRNETFDISKTVIKDGVKIGIVGMIGEGQTSSITSKYVEDLSFVNPLPLALQEATRLKEVENTQINVLLLHDDSSTVTNSFDYWKDEGKALSDYFDVVFCGHTHSYNDTVYDGVPLLQAYSNGQAFSKATITFDDNEVTQRIGQIEYAPSSGRTDVDVEAVIQKRLTKELLELGDRRAGYVSGTLSKRDIGAVGCKAIYDTYSSTYSDLACVMMNSQRDGLSGEVTYSDIFKATPFSNVIVIARVKGSDIIYEAKYNPTYTGNTAQYATLDSDQYYTCAVIDYLYYHTNADKQYDYFKGNRPGGGNSVIEVYDTYPYELIFDLFQKTPGNTINPQSFRGQANGYDLYS